jgi:hypothetical protein
VENHTTIYRLVLQPFMCRCRTGEGKRLDIGLGEIDGMIEPSAIRNPDSPLMARAPRARLS